ncbi:hypothetical protein, partial [Salmonella sp. SAL4438]|uniref:hypothetical protein n=1 Tax=Salmonella sp. SAL4438 TaxID=3159893 RepID=UPI00397A2C9D
SIRDHIQKYELQDIESSILATCETTSTKAKKGLFGAKAEVVMTGCLVTPKWLVWANARNNEALGAYSARLGNIQVQDYEKSEMHKLISDT